MGHAKVDHLSKISGRELLLNLYRGGCHEAFWSPWLTGMPQRTAHAALCLILGGVLERFPTVRFCLGTIVLK